MSALNSIAQAEAHGLRGERLLILVDGRSHTCYGKEDPTGLRLMIGTRTVLFTKEVHLLELRSFLILH